jgi:two-component system invasion response regulator UvrY
MPQHDVTFPASPTHSFAASDAVRVLCVDDQPLLIEGLEARFARTGRFRLIETIPTAHDLLDRVARLHPDLVLLDIEVPGPDAFEMAGRMGHLHPKLRYVLLSSHAREGCIAAARACGAWGYFAKSDSSDELVEALLEVAHGSRGTFVLSPSARVINARHLSLHVAQPRGMNAASGPLEGLTPCQIEVLRLIGKGLTRTQIASELSRSPKTIDGHQERLMRTLGIESRCELIRFAIREGLAEA